MFETLDEVISSYKNTKEFNLLLEREFTKNVRSMPDLRDMRHYFKEEMGSWGEDSFYWLWYLLVKDLPIKSFLEIGVYQGQFPILVKYLSKKFNKHIDCWLISPFDNTGDKYSKYDNRDYYWDFEGSFKKFGLRSVDFKVLQGLSQDLEIKQHICEVDKIDIIYIDGGHDYNTVKEDILFYAYERLADGGIVVFDDSMYYHPTNKGEGFFNGHPEVSQAVEEYICNDKRFINLFNISHNRIFLKNGG